MSDDVRGSNGGFQANLGVKIPTSLFKDKSNWIILLLALTFGANTAGNLVNFTEASAAKNSAETAKDNAETAKETAAKATKDIVTKTNAVGDKVDAVSEHLENGLAERISKKVISGVETKIKPLEQRMDRIERFLIGDANGAAPPVVRAENGGVGS